MNKWHDFVLVTLKHIQRTVFKHNALMSTQMLCKCTSLFWISVKYCRTLQVCCFPSNNIIFNIVTIFETIISRYLEFTMTPEMKSSETKQSQDAVHETLTKMLFHIAFVYIITRLTNYKQKKIQILLLSDGHMAKKCYIFSTVSKKQENYRRNCGELSTQLL